MQPLIRNYLVLMLLIGTFASIGQADEPSTSNANQPLSFRIETKPILEHDDGEFLWFHPRPVAFPSQDGQTKTLITIQKHLKVSDYYSGLYTMQSDDLGQTWSDPLAIPELDWKKDANGVVNAVADVTPMWHAASQKVITVGARVRYNTKGIQIEDIERSNQTDYAVYDPATNVWLPWRTFQMPPGDKFNMSRSACAQWLIEKDGSALLPFYIGVDARHSWSVTVVKSAFEKNQLTYTKHGTELSVTKDIKRGLYEPSLTKFQGQYFLTIRNDVRGYVSTSQDGLHFEPIKAWTFDDGEELGSYNTQQHWLSHSDGLFLVYTRRGANNDHITRHRAPLFIAQVDTEKLHVMRETEQVLVPERGATLGNFGAATITPEESWVTVSEGIWNDDARKRGATGATFLARVIWSRPNRDAR